MLDFGHIGSIGVHLSDRSEGRVGLAGDGSLRATYGSTDDDAGRSPSASPAPPRSTSPPARPRSTRTSPRAGILQPRPAGRVRGDPLQAGRAAPRGLPPDGHGADSAPNPATGVCDADGAVRGVDGLYVADASLFPTSVGVNPMMTIIAFAKQVAAGIAERAA